MFVYRITHRFVVDVMRMALARELIDDPSCLPPDENADRQTFAPYVGVALCFALAPRGKARAVCVPLPPFQAGFNLVLKT